MAKKTNLHFWLNYIRGIFLLLSISGCASVQSPTGGPRDTVSPKIIRETPENLTRNFSSNKIKIEFNELIKLNNETNEISISPELDRPPSFKIRKQILDIAFQDTLEENTTYTINFGKAIGDVNENNLLKNYTYAFSTGNTIDSLTLTGTASSALTKEKTDIIVFLLPVKQDSLFGKKKPSIFTTTDSAGNFKLQNLKENTYYIYALKEQGQGDRIYNSPNEEIGFISKPVILNKNISGINIQTFGEIPKKLTVRDKKIETDGRISLIFNKPAIDPALRILSPENADNSKITEFTPTLDSAFVWLPDLSFDSLQVALTDQGLTTDTVILRRNKRDTYTRNILLSANLSDNKLRPGTDLVITSNTPVVTIDTAKFTLLEDSVRVAGPETSKIEGNVRKIKVKYPWRNNRKYTIKLADGAVTDIYQTRSKASANVFTLDAADNYGNVSVKIILPDTSGYLIEMLREKKVVITDTIPTSGKLNFLNFPLGKYRFRVIYDQNKNGKWDTGNVKERRQPELIWEYDKEITLRPNWDIEEVITVPKRE